MKMEDLLKIESEEERISALYEIFDEDFRLSSKASRIEFLTTVRQIEKYLKPGMKILDLGAGTGEYSLYFAEKGYQVTAVDLVEKHVKRIKEKKKPYMKLDIFQGNALDLSRFENNSYDIVLCLGPLYHLEDIGNRLKCIEEVKRVCKDDGMMLFAFINNDMVIVTETMCYQPDYLRKGNYDRKTFKVRDFPFVFITVQQARELLKNSGLTIVAEIATDGLSELLADKINNMDDESYQLWLNFHFYYSEKPEFFGASNHLLFVAQKCK
ncbi:MULTISPECIES: class I SAM-dependent methyltransferase [Thermoanaerobacter]|uniref:Methyltransferase family protein n=2 Tax=Thermoanaerobacter TaxID=1754 RepID=I9ADS4_9THEO|nr:MULTISPECIES: class I SAM-dependent methyltransferase [Thermoanaerobacter]EGD50753.1 Methyltransferase type 11 [Thermoanaerobacter ethanolicus JW 200]SFE73220.1 Methyltransferase domain-containing protein [Thermoanaerobacter thermohydrosulfuricus]HHY79353.1 methyltransferase domain-containing protein [Thermoanaerobacter sp.]AEM80000.1 Methyltransferase type 11 [Thermoanaerobacter wiegelii Rt8.B1]EIW00177.1 methyltransferase family protein [Thermoanaerobacter siderophilus SR4]